MNHLLLKTGAATCALAILAAHGPAQAVSPLSLDEVAPLVVPVVNQETLSVEEDLRPDEVPAALEDDAPPSTPPKEREGKGSGDMEDEMLEKVGPGAE